MEFILKEEFNKDNKFSIWVLNLLIIRNDIKNSIMYFNDNEFSYEMMDNGRLLYHTRITLVHYREALKFLSESIEISESFFDLISDYEGFKKYQNIIKYAEPYQNSFLKEFCTPKRNTIVHYSKNNNAIRGYFDLVEDSQIGKVEITSNDKEWFNRHYNFADEIISTIVFNDMKSPKFYNNMKTFIYSSRYLIDLIDYIYDKYMDSNIIQ